MGTSGAAVVETLVAFPFFYLFFTVIVQLTFMESAALVTQHGAVVAARAGAVIGPDDPRYYGSSVDSLGGKRRDEIVEAVKLLTATQTDNPEVEVEISGGFREGGTVHAKVTLVYPCRIPFGGRFACGFGNTRRITRHAEMAYQGAGYEYP